MLNDQNTLFFWTFDTLYFDWERGSIYFCLYLPIIILQKLANHKTRTHDHAYTMKDMLKRGISSPFLPSGFQNDIYKSTVD